MPSFGKRRRSRGSTLRSSRRRLARIRTAARTARIKAEEGRFRKFTREEIAKRGDNLDISWLKDDSMKKPTTQIRSRLRPL